jgi:hypothetical protein
MSRKIAKHSYKLRFFTEMNTSLKYNELMADTVTITAVFVHKTSKKRH